jgi:putative aldouronate transport system permease protein
MAPWMERPSLPTRIGKGLLLTAVALAMLTPFVYVVAVSFSSHADVVRGGLILYPANPTLDAYRTVLQNGLVARSMQVSVWLTLLGTLVNMLLTATMAFGLSRPGMIGARTILFMVLFTFLFSPGLIPTYLLVRELGLLNTYASLVLPGAVSAFNLVVLRAFFMNIPAELTDSARIDGANDLQVLWHVTLPLSKAALAVVALFYGVGHWNDFFAATLYLSDHAMWPIQLVLRQYVLQGTALAGLSEVDTVPPPQRTVQMAIVVIGTLPILLVYPFLQRYFTKGVLTGAIKG